MSARVISLRVPGEMAAELAVLARAEEVSVSDVIRAAIQHFIAARSADEAFRARVRQRLEEDREVLERLSE